MTMAKSLIDSMSSKWNPEKYKDDYREALMEVIEEKVEAGGKEIEEKPKKAPKPTKVIDLVSVLQKSLEETGAKKKDKQQIARQKSAACEESSVRWIGFSEDDVEFIAKAQMSGGKAAVGNALRTTRSTFDAPAGLTRPLQIVQPERP